MEISTMVRELDKGLAIISVLLGDPIVEEAHMRSDADIWSALDELFHLVDE